MPAEMAELQHVPTPSTDHLHAADWERIYEPAEDTFLLLDALEGELTMLRARRPLFALEVGSGAGLVATAVARALPLCCCLTTDISQYACEATRGTARSSPTAGRVLPVRCDLVGPLSHSLRGRLDLLLFNPPYVPTGEEELTSADPLAACWAGGARGRTVLDRLLPRLPELMSPAGVVYVVAVQENDVADIGQWMTSMGFHMSVVMSRRAGPERLSVLRFMRSSVKTG